MQLSLQMMMQIIHLCDLFLTECFSYIFTISWPCRLFGRLFASDVFEKAFITSFYTISKLLLQVVPGRICQALIFSSLAFVPSHYVHMEGGLVPAELPPGPALSPHPQPLVFLG